ncbi:heavy-metal-associated domain-containing protein [Flagellimonas crocea]|uniref:heavy-metal-associated domain-containing protein n=1 Tax=Flagellimonas crocea TaxID=3067311 RepID=UPI00296FA7EF|nr:heavy metal-associated domain-containing protein [Muricauda sp. DH64]
MQTTFQVQNLKCGGCVKSISNKLSGIKEIKNVIVDKESSSVSFDHQSADDASLIKDALKRMGYPTIDDENGFVDRAKSFVSCASGKLA